MSQPASLVERVPSIPEYIIVLPAYQRRGIGSRIVASLTRFVESVPYQNTDARRRGRCRHRDRRVPFSLGARQTKTSHPRNVDYIR
jgi:GNAT superfamily N-acetyltransferase